MAPLYEVVRISELSPGPRRVSFTGQLVNIYDQNIESKMPKAAKGCLKLLVKDGQAMTLVKLWYTQPYEFRLGSLLTISTTHLSSASSAVNDTYPSTTPASILTSIFPERDIGCYIEECLDAVYRASVCRISDQTLMELITLQAFTGSDEDALPDTKMLVCVVAVGSLETFTSKTNMHMTAVSVGICDQSCHRTLTLYPPLISSAQDWRACHTILLISSAKRLRGGRITTTARTQIDVDPKRNEAASLRRWVQRDNCPTNEVFPAGLFDVEAVETSPLRIQFTLASLHSFIDTVPTQVYSGYLSVILAELHLVSLYIKQQVFSMECCGMPIYGNTLTGTCRQCGSAVGLRINPNLVGEIADETGAICSSIVSNSTRNSKILWSDEAWTDLWGGPVEVFAEYVNRRQIGLLQALEYRLSYMRVIMMIGWTGEYGGGRLAILRVVK